MNTDEINVTAFKNWLVSQPIEDCKMKIKADEITYTNDYCKASIRFNLYNIIEMEVTNNKDGNNEFYLHFQLNSFRHATDLFQQFKAAIKNVREHKTLRILLSCTSGLTTSYFAMMLNEGAQAIGLDYSFEAVDFTKLYHYGKDYDVILLAPQISYRQEGVKLALHHKLVIKIPALIFAKYDVVGMFKLIAEEVENYKNRDRKPIDLPLLKKFSNPVTTLVLGFIRHSDSTRIVYRIYEKEKIILDNEVIKPKISIEDMKDIIASLLPLHDIKMLGVIVPGIINNGEVLAVPDSFNNTNIRKYFETAFHLPVLLINDVNAMAVGHYITQDQTDNISFIFQPRGNVHSGLGNIIDGKLHRGYNNLSGEPQFVMNYLKLDKEKLSKTEEGSVEMVSAVMISLIAMIAPDKIIYYCDMIPDTAKIYDELKRYFPENLLPEIEKTIHLKDYMLIGGMYLCSNYYKTHYES